MFRLSEFRGLWPARLATSLALAGLICLMLVPVLRTGNLFGITGVTLIALCTDRGIEQVALDPLGQPIPTNTLHHHACACCLAAPDQGDQAISVGGVALSDTMMRVASARPGSSISVVPERYFLYGRGSRAPPLTS